MGKRKSVKVRRRGAIDHLEVYRPDDNRDLGWGIRVNDAGYTHVKPGVEYPPFMGVRMEWRKNAPSCGRLVYPAEDSVWEKYIADEKQAGNFTAWDPESDAAAAYRANFPNDNWTPIGYLRINKDEPDGSQYGQTDKWLVPHNFNVGTMVLVR